MADTKDLNKLAQAAVVISSAGLCVYILTWWIDLILAVAEPGPFDYSVLYFVPHIHEAFEPLTLISFALAMVILWVYLIALAYGYVSVASGKR